MAHGHEHGNHHGHTNTREAAPGHAHAPASFGRAFAVGISLNLAFVFTEAICGWLSNSLALIADAGHNLSDVLGLALAWIATMLVRRLPTQRRTYGLSRTSILAALANGLLLLAASGAILFEAVMRLGSPQPVASNTVMLVAAVGIAINGFTAWLFASGSSTDVNIRGAYLHMAADAAVSAGVVLAALAMHFTGWLWLDPLVSIAIAVVIVAGTWRLLRDSVNLALDAVPAHIDPVAVESYLTGLPGVFAVHDLHIWGMSTTEAALTVHLVKPDARVDDALLARIHADLREKFAIGHSTVQFELGDAEHPCHQQPASAL